MTGTRDGAIGRAEKYFDDGGFLAELQRRVAIPTTSQEQDSMPALQQYVSGEMTESLEKLGYDCTVLPNPRSEYGPFLIARRVEDASKPTVLTYGHGDVIRGQEEQWRALAATEFPRQIELGDDLHRVEVHPGVGAKPAG